MIEYLLIIAFVLIGIFTGFVSGLLGIGGGGVFVPTLYFLLPYLGVETNILTYVVIATSVFGGSFSASTAAFNHFRKNNIILKYALLLASGSIITAIVLPRYVVGVSPEILKIIIAVILFATAVNMLLEKKEKIEGEVKVPLFLLPLLGLFIGTVPVFTGLGGGMVFVPVLFYLLKLDIKKAIGTSSLIVACTLIISAISFSLLDNTGSNKQMLYLNFNAGIPLAIGAVGGAFIGVKTLSKTKSIIIKRFFSIFLLIVIILLLTK